MANTFGSDILLQTADPAAAADFYVRQLGFTITDASPQLIALTGNKINLYIEPGPLLGPVLEVTVPKVAETVNQLVAAGCEVVKDEPGFPRTYVRDPFGLIYNLTT